MTRVDLQDLLARRDIVHPTRLIGCDLAFQSIRLRFQGYSWWKPDQGIHQDRIDFVFEEVEAVRFTLVEALNNEDCDEILEDFSITSTHLGDWTDETEISIFGQAPLPDAAILYNRVHQYLQKEQALYSAWDFLNCSGNSLERLAELTNTALYLVGRAPHNVAVVICKELASQNVPYYQLEGQPLYRPRLIVRLEKSIFICKNAFAEFD